MVYIFLVNMIYSMLPDRFVLHMIKGAITALSPIQFLPFSYFNQDGNTPCRVASVLDGASNLFRWKGFSPCPVSRLFRSNYVIIHIINYWNATVVKANDTPFLPWWKQHANSKHPENIHFTYTAFDLVIVRCSWNSMSRSKLLLLHQGDTHSKWSLCYLI
jgi:hypothetical protein